MFIFQLLLLTGITLITEECTQGGEWQEGKLSSSLSLTRSRLGSYSDAVEWLLPLADMSPGITTAMYALRERYQASHQTVHIFFLANDRRLRDYDLVVAHSTTFALSRHRTCKQPKSPRRDRK